MLEDLIPYIRPPEKLIADLPVIGPLKLQVFGPLVAVGVILGYHRCLQYAKKRDIDALRIKTSLLRKSHDYYSIWNVRRIILIEGFLQNA